jgi:acetylornithine/N-succinyldiaminopimelate aminotransferase
VRGHGVYLYDAEGKSYLDFGSGIAVNSLGYDDPGSQVGAARRRRRADPYVEPVSYGTGERLAAALGRAVVRIEGVLLQLGRKANEGAFKFARRWARTIGEAKHEIIALRGSFHGRLFGSLAARIGRATGFPSVRSRRESRSSSGISRSSMPH